MTCSQDPTKIDPKIQTKTGSKDSTKTNKGVYHGIINQLQGNKKLQEQMNEIMKMSNTSEEMKKKQQKLQNQFRNIERWKQIN